MDPSILLLDCSEALANRLRRFGYSVASASVGYLQPRKALPAPIYEYEVIIYNPMATDLPQTQISSELEATSGDPLGSPLDAMLKKGYESELSRISRTGALHDDVIRDFLPLPDHVQKGAILVAFINAITDDIAFLNQVYSWIPNMPQLERTRDSKIDTVFDTRQGIIAPQDFLWLSPVLSVDILKRPVLHTIALNQAFAGSLRLFFNKRGDCLGLFQIVGNGQIFLLPEYEDNDYVIATLLTRVLPRIGKQPERKDLIDAFSSPTEQKTTQEVQAIRLEQKMLDERYNRAKEALAFAEREKRRIIENDEAAVRIIAYYKQAAQDEDAALFYLYKVIDALQKKFGGETAAKNMLGTTAEWKLIGMKANASYGDIRHAPNPGEKIKPWDQDEISECFSAAEKVIAAYLSTLF